MEPHTIEAINKLWEAYHHAYDPETCREDLAADFDKMRALVYQAIRILDNQDTAPATTKE